MLKLILLLTFISCTFGAESGVRVPSKKVFSDDVEMKLWRLASWQRSNRRHPPWANLEKDVAIKNLWENYNNITAEGQKADSKAKEYFDEIINYGFNPMPSGNNINLNQILPVYRRVYEKIKIQLERIQLEEMTPMKYWEIIWSRLHYGVLQLVVINWDLEMRYHQ